ncbi:hypothetical protein N7509_000397 [Penicillium cosmopolitanum]|uniref:Uncharacterized protein n=1 Tax=Penicillium cosmopolitanum TaxID=1131564 RepID=A0A9W9WA77_9EURO|nr:uncharacterized protein N7509_000397 [Penicillium cosmopolitanum]KAJ5413770.1 hypothetical protein N7509_000397 [Penicillium cosmopolitanum]
MTVYHIRLVNEDTSDHFFSFVMDPPETLNKNGIFSSCWISMLVSSGGNLGVSTDVDCFAWAGTVPRNPAPGVEVPTGVGRLASLGTERSKGSSFQMKTTINDAATLTENTHGAPTATFEIFTGNDLPSPNNRYLIGMAKMDGHGRLIPVATVLASNQTTTQIKPKMKFYISRAEYPASFIVDFTSISRNAGVVDFSSGEGQNKHFAIVRYTKNGDFKVDYHKQSLEAQEKGLVEWVLEKLHHLVSSDDYVDCHAFLGPGGGSAPTTAEEGETKTARFRLTYPVRCIYNCAAAPVPVYIADCMYGLIYVQPAEGDLPPVDHEYYVP